MLSTLLEGESLFNDASSIVLFEIFLHMGMNADAGGGDVSLTGAAWGIVKLIGWLSMTGAAAGLLMGLTTRWGGENSENKINEHFMIYC
jgi:NhaP-type Na+/H+ or K+/H+ antiporter